jgi:chorismate mutase-like protein
MIESTSAGHMFSQGGNGVMSARESKQTSADTGTVSDRVLLDALVRIAARRLVLGVDVAAAKFLSGQRIDDHVREQEILESMAGRLKRDAPRHALGMEFFRDQIEANKVIQRGLHRYWGEHPEEFPARHRHLTSELRPQLDIANRNMLLVLIRMKNMPPVRRSHIGGLFDRKLRTSITLRRLGELRRDAAGIALRSLYRYSQATITESH